jgi:hypothetical protein
MKNFYELTDTNNHSIAIGLLLRGNGDTASIKVSINGNVLYDGIIFNNDRIINTSINISDSLDVKIICSNMAGCAISIIKLTADDVEIMPKYNYLTLYKNTSNIENPTSILEFDGVWSLDTEIPLLNWMHNSSNKGWLLYP